MKKSTFATMVIAQSGGPSMVINQSLVGAVLAPSLPLENLKIAFPPKPACVFRLRAS